MDEIIEKINNILRYQINFNWQNIYNYKGYKNSFEYHVQHHPKDEKKTGKWDSLIDYSTDKTISNSYYKTSVDLSKKFALISKDKYDIQYIEKHASVNVVDMNNGLIACLKYNKNKICFDIATCFFPSKLNMLFSIKNKIFSANNQIKKENDINKLYFIPYKESDTKDEMNINAFEEAMREFFGINSIEYKILFKNEINNIDDFINVVADDINDYLNLMDEHIQNEDDKKYHFVFNDGIEYVAKLSLLYKIKDTKYEKLYQKFLDIDINNVYKDALDECKKYIDEGEKSYGNNN